MLPAPLAKLAGHVGVSFVSGGRVISFNVATTLLSETTFRNGDWFRETASGVFSGSSKTGSPVLLVKPARTIVSLSVSLAVR